MHSTVSTPDTEAKLEPGSAFTNLEWEDIQSLLYGNEDFHGYLNYERALDLERDLGIRIADYRGEPIRFLEKFIDEVNHHYKDRWGVLYNDVKEEYLRFPLDTRMSDRYRANVGDDFDTIEEIMKESDQSGVHLTMSFQMDEGDTVLDSLAYAKSALNEFVTYCKNVESVNGNLDYIGIEEPNQAGHAHLHVLFPFRNWLMPKDQADEWMERNGYGEFLWIERLEETKEEPPEDFKNYLVSYLNDFTTHKLWMAIMVLTRSKTLRKSEGINERIRLFRADQVIGEKEEQEGKWYFIGIFSGEIVDLITEYEPPPVLLWDAYETGVGRTQLENTIRQSAV